MDRIKNTRVSESSKLHMMLLSGFVAGFFALTYLTAPISQTASVQYAITAPKTSTAEDLPAQSVQYDVPEAEVPTSHGQQSQTAPEQDHVQDLEPDAHPAPETEKSTPESPKLSKKETLQLEVQAAYPKSDVPKDQIPGHHTHMMWLENHRHGDIPIPPPENSPYSDTWENSVSICACMLKENTTDVREWLMYHR